jgi:hypothetical protein
MISYLSIRDFVNENPNVSRFRVFRISDSYMFTVKEVKQDTVILNTHVNIEVSQDSTEYKVHESNFGLDYTTPKIFRYAPDSLDKPVQSLNIKKELNTRLHNKTTWVFGRILKEEFYPFKEDLRAVDYDDLIADFTYDYEFHPLTREVVYRLEIDTWYDEYGNVVKTKPQPKIYEGHKGMSEAQTRRSNIINDLKHNLDSMSKGSGSSEIIEATQSLIIAIDPYINMYIKYGSYEIVHFIESHENLLLSNEVAPNLTVRIFMTSKLDFLSAESENQNLYKGSML